METVTISPKFQVVIPKGIRSRLKLRPGQKIQAIPNAGFFSPAIEATSALVVPTR
jgi:AbrB family looped-hinge helix DNA binding protein